MIVLYIVLISAFSGDSEIIFGRPLPKEMPTKLKKLLIFLKQSKCNNLTLIINFGLLLQWNTRSRPCQFRTKVVFGVVDGL